MINLVLRTSLDSSHFARRYLGNLIWFIFLALLRCFSSRRAQPVAIYTIADIFLQQADPAKRDRVAPFGNRRIIGLWHLPDEYRRRMRPSSAKASKAFIIGINE